MKINTALILCAGFGERLKPLTLKIPKPLLTLSDLTMLEHCIKINIKLGMRKILLNTFYLGDQIENFIKSKNFSIDIQVIGDGNKILNTGGGILNMINNSQENDFIIFNPDTLWNRQYISEIKQMSEFYFSNNLNNILLLTNKKKSFDKNLKGDFNLTNNSLKKSENNDFIYIGCQILNRNLLKNYQICSFSVSKIWNELLKKNELNGFESASEFYHLTNLETFKRLQDF